MSFASPIFLWYFMPAVLAAVVVAPRGWRNGVVATASLVFYAVGAGPTTLLLLACMLGTGPMVIDDASVGLTLGGAALVPRTARAIAFKGKHTMTLGPGEEAWSDPVALTFVSYPSDPKLQGHARFVDAHTLEVTGERITANAIVIATGSRSATRS